MLLFTTNLPSQLFSFSQQLTSATPYSPAPRPSPFSTYHSTYSTASAKFSRPQNTGSLYLAHTCCLHTHAPTSPKHSPAPQKSLFPSIHISIYLLPPPHHPPTTTTPPPIESQTTVTEIRTYPPTHLPKASPPRRHHHHHQTTNKHQLARITVKSPQCKFTHCTPPKNQKKTKKNSPTPKPYLLLVA